MKKGFKEKYKDAGISMKESRKQENVDIDDIKNYIKAKGISTNVNEDKTLILNKSDISLMDDIVSKARYVKVFEVINSTNKVGMKFS